jgi:hypothetical protein
MSSKIDSCPSDDGLNPAKSGNLRGPSELLESGPSTTILNRLPGAHERFNVAAVPRSHMPNPTGIAILARNVDSATTREPALSPVLADVLHKSSIRDGVQNGVRLAAVDVTAPQKVR